MSTPERCPKCNETDCITNITDLFGLFGQPNEMGKQWSCDSCEYLFDDDEAARWYDDCDFSEMKLSQIADVVFADWKDISPYALPYVEAMMNLNSINDTYGSDDASSVISYFLVNAKKWQGETARRVKAHLNALVRDYYKSIKIRH